MAIERKKPENGKFTGRSGRAARSVSARRRAEGANGASGDGAKDRRGELIARCRAGEESAWSELYGQLHDPLRRTIRWSLGPGPAESALVEELAAHVWYVLWRDRRKILNRFDPARDGSLTTYLSGVARLEVMQQMRSRRRRKARELGRGIETLRRDNVSALEIGVLLNEFAATLSDREKQFLEDYLLSIPDRNGNGDRLRLSGVNVRQMRHRLRRKLVAFLDEP